MTDERQQRLDGVIAGLHWLSRVRRMADVSGPEADRLAEFLLLDSAEPSALISAIDAAIPEVADDAYRRAAMALVGPDGRWETIKNRHRRAGSEFGVGGDAYRRRPGDGRPSREEETLQQLARALVGAHGGEEGPGDRSRPPDPPGPDSPRRDRSGRRDRLLLASIGILALVGLSVAAAARLRDETGAAPPPARPDGCPHGIGQPADEGSIPSGVVEAIRFETETSASSQRCALTAVERLGESPIYFQELGSPGETPAVAVVAFEDGGALTMPFAAWGSYRQIGGQSGDNAYSIAGRPTGLTTTASAAYVSLDSDVQLVAEVRHAPYFFVLAPAIEVWNREGGIAGPMGRPTSNPQVVGATLRQEFETGWLELVGDGEVVWRPASAAQRRLPAESSIGGRLLRQADGTVWFVTPDLRRKWIPDGRTFGCLGGWDEIVSAEVAGYAIAQLEYGGLATCGDTRVGPIDVWGFCNSVLGDGARGEVVAATADWECIAADGAIVPADLQAACDDQYPDERHLVSRRDGDPTAWHCASPGWTPLTGGGS